MKKTLTRTLAICLALAGTTAWATDYDISVNQTVPFNSSADTLTNATPITSWTTSHLKFTDGSDFTGVDFTALGITSWAITWTGSDVSTTWDGANLTNLVISMGGAAHNFGNDDSFVGVNFSGTRINSPSNQPFRDANLTDANFSNAEFNFTFRVNHFAYATLTRANFSNAAFVHTTTQTGGGDLFSGGPGTTSVADRADAANFSGADISNFSDTAWQNILTRLGKFDGPSRIGAFYSATTVLPAGVTVADLDAAGWQDAAAVNNDYDISTDTTVTFDSAVDTLTNATPITSWTASNLKFNDGSDFTGFDFTALGITSWTAATLGTAATTTWDNADLSGLAFTHNADTFGYNDSFLSTDFSAATITSSGNQPFLDGDLTGADFSGATLDFSNASVNEFQGADLSRVSFSGATFAAARSAAGNLFSGGPGTTGIHDRPYAVDFSGADLSNFSGDAWTNMRDNLGAFDGAAPIGAFYDGSTVLPAGATFADLDTAGWQDAAATPLIFDISEDRTVSFDSSVNTLTNTAPITAWGTGNLVLTDGSDFSDVDFTALGITSWTMPFFLNSVTTWDRANLSGLTLTPPTPSGGTFFGYNDKFVGTDFSGATITTAGNLPFVFSDLTDADFSGATFNFTYGTVQEFRATITRASFSNATFATARNNSGWIFQYGSGTTSEADKANAADFRGADLSLIGNTAWPTVLSRLGGFDGEVAIGAFFDTNTVPGGVSTLVDLIEAGWQGSLPQSGMHVLTAKSNETVPKSFSSTDLAQTEYFSSSATDTNGREVLTQHAELFNGLVGNNNGGYADSGEVTMDSGNTVTINFDISTNTGGYDITRIESIFGWSVTSGGRANQGYEIILTFVNDSTATLAGPTHWEPNSPASYWTKVAFTMADGGTLNSDTIIVDGTPSAGTGVTARKVKAITFDISEDANPGSWVLGREIDIFGTPTVAQGTSISVR